MPGVITLTKTAMKNPDPNKQKELTAESLKRIAKALRIRSKAHLRQAKTASKHGDIFSCAFHTMKAEDRHDLATELDVEADTLRAMR